MKKLFSMMFIVTLLGLVFTACGDDKDEPEVPKTQNLVTAHESDTDQYFVFDIDMNKDKSTIYMYNIQFAPNAPKMTLRVNVPVTLNKSGSAYIMTGTNLVCDMNMPSAGWVPMTDEQYLLNNLTCTVNPSAKLYAISFDAHGGHFEESGKLQ
jgi:hypothetical protein